MLMGILFALLSSVTFGSSAVFARVGLQYIGPLIGTLIAVFTSLIFVSMAVIAFDLDSLISVSFVAVLWFALLGILNFPLARNFLFLGLRAIGASRASAIGASSPLFALIFIVTILRESVTVPLIIGTFSVIGGLVLVLFEGDKFVIAPNARIWGYIFSFSSALCYGIGLVITKWGVSKLTTPLSGCIISLAFGFLTLFLLAVGKGININVKANKKAIGLISISGLLSAAGLFSLYSAMSMTPASVVSPLYGTHPLFTLLGVHFFLQRLEKITTHIVIGCLLVVIGGILITLGTLRS